MIYFSVDIFQLLSTGQFFFILFYPFYPFFILFSLFPFWLFFPFLLFLLFSPFFPFFIIFFPFFFFSRFDLVKFSSWIFLFHFDIFFEKIQLIFLPQFTVYKQRWFVMVCNKSETCRNDVKAYFITRDDAYRSSQAWNTLPWNK